MEHEKQKTHRQEWNEHSDLVQDDINRTLKEFGVEIEAANITLAELYETDPEAAGEFGVDIVEYLDDHWRYASDLFHISGSWYKPIIELSEEGVQIHQSVEPAFNIVQSNGFMVKLIENEDGDELPVVGMSFVLGSEKITTPNIQGEFYVLAFAELDGISIQYLRPGDTSVVSTELGEVSETIHRIDSLLRLYTNHEGSAFFQQTARKQEKFLRSLIEQVEAVLPAPGALDKVILRDIETSIVRTKLIKDDTLVNLRSVNGEKFKVSGSLVGVTMADIADKGFGVHYKSPQDHSIAKDGLSLIVQPSETNINLSDSMNSDLLIPLAAIDNLSMTLE